MSSDRTGGPAPDAAGPTIRPAPDDAAPTTTAAPDDGALDDGTPDDAATSNTGSAPGPTPGPTPDQADSAASAALARARATARAKGLRPGSPAARRTGARRTDPSGASGSGPDARDPALLGEQVARLTAERGWAGDVSAGTVMGRWPAIVGADVAAHSQPVSFQDGILTVRAESTAWATNLRLLSATLVGRIQDEAGPDVVTELRIVGPSAPSWSRGLRRTEGGRGPRDTYG